MYIANEMINVESIDKAFEYWYNKIKEIARSKEYMESRDGTVVGEILNAITVIQNPTKCIMQNKIRKMSMRYAIGEMLWYMSGNKNLSEIQKYTSAWDRMSDDGKTVNSNYGWCIKDKYGFNQWEHCKHLLKKDRNTRQAVIHIKTASDEESKDVNCTCYLQFFIRDGKLIMHTHMRSNDLWMGFPYDIFQFTCMQILMSMELGIELGEYVHIVDNLHMYQRDFEKALKNEKEMEVK